MHWLSSVVFCLMLLLDYWVLWWHEIFETWLFLVMTTISISSEDRIKFQFEFSVSFSHLYIELVYKVVWTTTLNLNWFISCCNDYLSFASYPSNVVSTCATRLVLYRWTFLRPRRPTARTRSAGSTLSTRWLSTRRVRIACLPRESAVMTASSQDMVVRPSLSSTRR